MKRTTQLVLLLLSLAWFTTAIAAEVGKITRLKGSADIQRSGQSATPLKLGDVVSEKDILRTHGGSLLQITFNDGSKVSMAQKTRMVISEYVTDKQPSGLLDVTRGRIRAFVSDTFSKRKESFRTRSRTAIAGVQGTDYEMHAHARSTDVLVHEGLVSVKNIDTNIPKTLFLSPGQMSTTQFRTPPKLVADIRDITTSNSPIKSGSTQDLRSSGSQAADPIGSKPLDSTRIPLPATPNLP